MTALARLADLRELADIARATGVSPAEITRAIDAEPQHSLYTVLQIRKRGRGRAGQFRVVHKARHEWLSQLHRGVAMLIMESVAFGAHVQGFVRGRSIVTNAQQHLGAREVLHADIKDFFDAITTQQVERGLISLGTSAPIAKILARACTIDGFVRQGTRCSPVLANLVCRQLDVDFLSLAGAHGAVYTRYADDVTLSGDRTPTTEAVEQILAQHGFALRDGSCYVQHRGRAQFVTGLHVGDPGQARLPGRLKRQLRLILHYVEKFGVDGHFFHPGKARVADDAEALAGMLRYAQSVEPRLALKLRKQYRAGAAKSWADRQREQSQED